MATNDIVSYDEALAFLGSPTDREGLETWITAISERMDEGLGPVVIRTVTSETHDGGSSIVQLQAPVASVTSITERDGATTNTLTAESSTASTTAYTVDLMRGRIRRRSNWQDVNFAAGYSNITVTYTAGVYASTATCGARYKQCALIILKHMWNSQKGTGNTVYSPNDDLVVVGSGWLIPRPARDLLAGKWISAVQAA